MSRCPLCRMGKQTTLLFSRESQSQGVCDLLRHIVFERKNIGHLFPVMAAPEFGIVACVDEIRVHFERVSDFRDAAFENARNVQLAADLARVHVMPLESVDGIPRHHAKPVQLREARCHRACNPISQIFEVWISASIGERKHGN